MNNLSGFYQLVKDFCEDHNMINEFLFLGSEEELSNREFNYRSFVMIPSSSNISRDLSRPIYTLSFDCAILDRCSPNNELELLKSTEENLFVAGQLQDYLIQQDENCYIEDVDVASFLSEDENVTSAMFEVIVSFGRKDYNLEIDN
jgi:hypothetical protein